MRDLTINEIETVSGGTGGLLGGGKDGKGGLGGIETEVNNLVADTKETFVILNDAENIINTYI